MKKRKRQAEDVIKGYLLATAYATKILNEKYGFGSQKRLPEFAESMMDGFSDWVNGNVGYNELIKLLETKTGLKLED